MDAQSTAMLETVLAGGTPTYAATARELLNGTLNWSQAEINEFLDGYLNDPYLTRNE